MLNIETTEIKIIIEECINTLKYRADLKELDLHSYYEDDFPKFILTDENRVRQILINLISNAIKYTNRGFVKVNCKKDDHGKNILI